MWNRGSSTFLYSYEKAWENAYEFFFCITILHLIVGTKKKLKPFNLQYYEQSKKVLYQTIKIVYIKLLQVVRRFYQTWIY